MPDIELPDLKMVFLDGLQAARQGVLNPYEDFDRGCAFALGQHWTDPPREQRVYFTQARRAGITRGLAHRWALERDRG